ncbi:hypothetical protein ACWGI1_19560, partial [Streptomyces sp. NPDC054835]
MRPIPTRARVDDPPRRGRTARTAAVTLAALLLGTLPVAGATTATAAPAPGKSDPAKGATTPKRTANPADTALHAKATAEAKRTGKPVELASKRTETDDVWANPDGTFTQNHALTPVRVLRDGK